MYQQWLRRTLLGAAAVGLLLASGSDAHAAQPSTETSGNSGAPMLGAGDETAGQYLKVPGIRLRPHTMGSRLSPDTGASAIPEEEPEDPPIGFITAKFDNINVRSSKSIHADNVVGTMKAADQLPVIGRGDGFYTVIFGGEVAYVSEAAAVTPTFTNDSNATDSANASSSQDQSAPVVPDSIAAGDTVRVVVRGGTDLWNAPEDTIVGHVRNGDEFEVIMILDGYLLIDLPGMDAWIRADAAKVAARARPPFVIRDTRNTEGIRIEQQEEAYESLTVVQAEAAARQHLQEFYKVPVIKVALKAGPDTQGYQSFNGTFELDLKKQPGLKESFDKIASTGKFNVSMHVVDVGGFAKTLIVTANKKYWNSVITSIFSGAGEIKEAGITSDENLPPMACREDAERCKEILKAMFETPTDPSIPSSALVDPSISTIVAANTRGLPAQEFTPQNLGLLNLPEGSSVDRFGVDVDTIRPAGVLVVGSTIYVLGANAPVDDSNVFFRAKLLFEEAKRAGAPLKELRWMADQMVADAGTGDFSWMLAQVKAYHMTGQNPVLLGSEGSRLVMILVNFFDVPSWAQQGYDQFMNLMAMLEINTVNYTMETDQITVKDEQGKTIAAYTKVVDLYHFLVDGSTEEFQGYTFSLNGKDYNSTQIHFMMSNPGNLAPLSRDQR